MKKETKREMKKKKEKKNIFSYIGRGFVNYFKNIHVALPMLIWLVIFLILFFAVIVPILFKSFLSSFNTVTSGISLENQFSAFSAESQISKFAQSIKILLIVGLIIVLVLLILYLLFISSTLEFSKNIVNETERKKGFVYYFKKSFSYGKKWLKYLAINILIILISLPYFALCLLLLYLSRNSIAGIIAISIIMAIIYYLLILFISPSKYVIFYYDSKILKSIAISAKNVKKFYGKFLLLNIILDIIIFALNFIFSFIFLNVIVYFLFSIQFKALVIMEFMKDNFKA